MKAFNEIVSEQLHIAKGDINDSLTPKDVPQWDSMNYLLFISEIEKEYNITFSMDEVLSAQSLGDVRTTVRNKGISI